MVTLDAIVVDDHLVITLDRETGDIIVCGNEILVGEPRNVTGHRRRMARAHQAEK